MPVIDNYPAFVFTETNWDDFDYKSSFILFYYKNARNRIEIGNVKILQEGKLVTHLPTKFRKLSDKFCSLGQANFYYETLTEFLEVPEIEVLMDDLNDVGFNVGLRDQFEKERGYSDSLIRFSEAKKALNEARRIIYNLPVRNTFRFKFTSQAKGFSVPHEIPIFFDKNAFVPGRIIAFIGKNGAGKTQILSNLASSLSGLSNQGKFSTKYAPPFSRVLAVSYSLFDSFAKPTSSRVFSYFYCGIQTEKGILSEKQIARKFKAAYAAVVDQGLRQVQLLGKYVDELVGSELAELVFGKDYDNTSPGISFYDEKGYSVLSSGQSILLLILTEILAYIRPESLILFDEPETHLHPNAMSGFVAVLTKIVNKFDSYAIVATHASQIIQELPSKYVLSFQKDGEGSVFVRRPSIETFGENLTTLTQTIFQSIDERGEHYKHVLKQLSNLYSAEEIIEWFEEEGRPLSANARIYLETLYRQ